MRPIRILIVALALTENVYFASLFLPECAAVAEDQTASVAQVQDAPTQSSQHKFYPPGYVSTVQGAPVPGSRHFYPPGYSPAQLQSKQVSDIRQKSVALSLSKIPATLPLVAPSSPITARGGENSTVIKAPTIIKVGLVLNTSSVNIVPIDSLELHDCATGACLGILPASSVWRISDDGTQLKFELVNLSFGLEPVSGETQADNTSGSVIRHESFAVPFCAENNSDIAVQSTHDYILESRIPDGLTGLNGKAYRGKLWLHRSAASTFSAIDILSLEDYLLSVVPSEMPSNWPIEALKAQAIAARSYALANMGKHGLQGFDVRADTEDQMYTGVLAETVSGNQAVAQTTGIVIKNQGKIVPAFYHSTSGGSTEISFGKDYPFLQQVADYDDASPKFIWIKKVPVGQLEQALRSRTQRCPIGQLQNIEILSRTPSKILVSGTLGSLELSGDQARGAFGLPSSNFNVMLTGDQCIFSGRGFGHRMGLSQWGAKALAEHGYNAAQILSYYYKDVSLDYP